MSKPTLTVTSDFTKEFESIVKKFRNDIVLVGIPESRNSRTDDSDINNATILAINEFGSPMNNIPPRPVMAIGIENSKEAVAAQFAQAAQAALNTNGSGDMRTFYDRAGLIASNSVKKAINDQIGFEGPAESTLAQRKRRGFKGTKSLIVTGQLRNSITYVVQRKG